MTVSGAGVLRAAVGFGENCLPKDIRAFRPASGGSSVGDAWPSSRRVDRVNELTMRAGVIRTVAELLGRAHVGDHGDGPRGRLQADSDDMRNSPPWISPP